MTYTPNTNTVRAAYEYAAGTVFGEPAESQEKWEIDAEFYRWLAEVQTQAKRQGYAAGVSDTKSIVSEFIDPDSMDFEVPNPY